MRKRVPGLKPFENDLPDHRWRLIPDGLNWVTYFRRLQEWGYRKADVEYRDGHREWRLKPGTTPHAIEMR